MDVTCILWPHDAGPGALLGGKGRALAALGASGLPVPPWFAVSPDAFWASLSEPNRAALVHAVSDDGVQRVVAGVSPSLDVRSAIASALTKLAPARRFAVRSSASDEDGAQHSLAGQLESFLNVAAGDVVDRVADVWRSGFGARVLAYRRQNGLSLVPRAPAVLVQQMVDARAAGVAFSADPVTGRRAIAVISAVEGLGERLVSGEASADTWHVDRDNAIGSRYIIGAAPVLRDDEVRAIATLARRAEGHFGRPQDIEWASDGDALYVLQSRPITSIVRLPDPDGVVTIWDNSNIVESYSGVTTPLTFSFASEIYEHVYRQFCRIMRVPERQIARHDQTFRNMLGLIRGRMYYNLLNWYRVLALLPGFAINRRFMEQMMGVKEGVPETLVRELEPQSAGGRLRDAAHVARTLGGLIAQHFRIGRSVRAFYARLDGALATPNPPLEQRRADELVAHYRDLRDQLLFEWDAPLVNDFFAMIFYGVLRKLTHAWCGDHVGTLQNDLIGGQGGLVSAEPAVRLQRLAQLARADSALLSRLKTGSTAEVWRAAASGGDFARELRAYLDKFGERSVNELKLETETLHDDPLPLFRAIGTLASQPAAHAHATRTSGDLLRAAAQDRLTKALAGRPLRRMIFHWVLGHARRRVRDRENLRLERTRLFGRVRRIFLEIGRRLAAIDVLADPRDVFYLEIDEVLAFVEGRATTTSLKALVAVRRREFDDYEKLPPPAARFETRGVAYHGDGVSRASAELPTGGDERRGLGCSPGIVRGPVRIVTDPRLVDLERQAILIAEHTDPGWIMIFPSALGVLVERGSLLSHAAIVARELGIPAIVAIPGITRWVSDGDWVEFDGSTGIVRRVAARDRREDPGA